MHLKGTPVNKRPSVLNGLAYAFRVRVGHGQASLRGRLTQGDHSLTAHLTDNYHTMYDTVLSAKMGDLTARFRDNRFEFCMAEQQARAVQSNGRGRYVIYHALLSPSHM